MRGSWALGLGLLGAAFLVLPSLLVLTEWRPSWMPRPGRLVAETDSLTWNFRSQGQGSDRQFTVATFRVANKGGTPVSIRSVSHGCDCVVSRIEPRLIQPGAVGRVEVHVEPSGNTQDRTILLTLETDSAETPIVELRLRLIGDARPKPPYLLNAYGDLVYSRRVFDSDVREVTVISVQETGRHDEPKVASDLPFIRLEPLGHRSTITTEPTYSLVTHAYAVHVEDPPPGRFRGEIQVVDPWNGRRVKGIRVYGDCPSSVVVSPPRLQFHRAGARQEDHRALLRVEYQDPSLTPTAEVEGGTAAPISVVPLPSTEVNVSLFEVGLHPAPDRRQEGIVRLVVRPSSESPERIVVPVRIINGGSDDETTR